ncbi:hypothetical protein [Pasteurella multocida]|uniref:hypothetical protein n=1 Tax=Pasteurella multocida TaxID=747 RepID=UPI000DC495FE|nr:hypothetical protein [Pasteurella multocida]MCT8984048.1 hypothetical protein [Pasteurella multocida]NNI47747.1 hypothetical protein [Pasteurella multocida]QNM47427.1 hypothetical protein HJ472_09145 [Pasteurella multocida]QNM49647.1 hypothetical protein HJ473_09145 [Pasteurella multocida]RAQ37876.1 hypothetical protein DPQ28_03840 [Pasteurella multocida]
MKVTFNPPHPSINDDGFAEETVHAFIKQHYPDSYHEDALVAEEYRDGIYKSLIAEFHCYQDPQVLMTLLIQDYGWEFTYEDLCKIEKFELFVNRQIYEKENQWIQHNDIKPPFPIGAKVRLPSFYEEKIGTIVAINKYRAARYNVMTKSQIDWNNEQIATGSPARQCGHIIKFEDLELIED